MISATCELVVDGARLADTLDDLLADEATALDGLSIAWGRETTTDQPDTSTCSFTVRDRGGADFLSTLAVGRTVEVFSTVTVPATGGFATNVAEDPGYDALPVGSSAVGVRVTTGSAATVVASDATHGHVLSSQDHAAYLTPATSSAATGAWDDIPTLDVGDEWRWAIAVKAPTHVKVGVTMIALASPAVGAAVLATVGATVTRDGTGAWQTISSVVTSDQSTGWPGLKVDLQLETTWSQASGTWATQTGTWKDWGYPIFIDDLALQPPLLTSRHVLVWSGRISDLTATPSDDGLGVDVAATAVDFTADLANVYLGDTPWLAETMSARFARILTLVGSGAPDGDVDSSIGGYRVSWRDVDSQAAGDLLQDLATTVDGVLWAATHISTGPRLWVEDPQQRAAVATIGLVDGVWTITITGSTELVTITSCDLLAEPVQWTQDTAEVITRVDATYLAQTLDAGQPAPTEAHVLIVDAAAEAQLGVRRLGWTSQLTTATDAQSIGADILDRSRNVDWRINGLTWDTLLPLDVTADDANAVASLLDGTLRLGLPLIITDLPAWAPSGASQSGVYVEGGTWTYEASRWVLAMTVTPGAHQATPMTWAQAPLGWTWATTDPVLSWRELTAVGP